MYTYINYPSKKALKEAVASGAPVRVFQPGPFAKPSESYDGKIVIEGPHYPEPHRFYATAMVKAGVIIPGTVK